MPRRLGRDRHIFAFDHSIPPVLDLGPGELLTVETHDSYVGKVASIQEDAAPPRMEYDPGHPDANAQGYVAYPNVNMVEEMVDMITASRAYEAGITALDTAVSLAERAISIGG